MDEKCKVTNTGLKAKLYTSRQAQILNTNIQNTYDELKNQELIKLNHDICVDLVQTTD